jgi:hypothetical protein
MRNNNFVGRHRGDPRGEIAVDSPGLAGCGLEVHDSDPSEAWTSLIFVEN